MENEEFEIKNVYNPNTAFEILENNGGFQTFGWCERDEKMKFEFCEYFGKLPHDLRLRILKHASQIDDSIQVMIDTFDLYLFFKEYSRFVISKEILKDAKVMYMNCITSRDRDVVSREYCENFKDLENFSWSIEKGDVEDTIYIAFYDKLDDVDFNDI